MAYYEGRIGEAIGSIAAMDTRLKGARLRLRIMRAMWKEACREWIAERRARAKGKA